MTAPRVPEWTTTPPTVPGWYWFDSGATEIVRVENRNGVLVCWWSGNESEELLSVAIEAFGYTRFRGPLAPD